jgi:hypothetical protein
MKALFNFQLLRNGFLNVVRNEGAAITAVVILMMTLIYTQAQSAPRPYQDFNASAVEISMWDASEFVILFDNKSYGNRTHIAFNQVSAGRHQVKIYKRVYDRISQKHRMQILVDEVIVVPAKQKLIYQVDRNNRLQHIRTERLERPRTQYPGQYRPAPVRELPPQYQPVEVFVPATMNTNDFGTLKQMVRNASFEETRMTLIKQAIGDRFITAQQVLELMQMMSFESTRLELAKWAYPKALDSENYFIVNQGFSFSSSINDLANFIARH